MDLPVVPLHGAYMNGSLWAAVVDELAADHRLRRARPSVRRAPDAAAAAADQPACGIAALIGDFLDRLGPESVVAVGRDTGEALAQLLVAERSERVGRLVLASCDAFDNSNGPSASPVVTGRLVRLPLPTRLPCTWGRMAKKPVRRR